jgi:predicted RNA binding protein YcfA (HicA-like mRNA interferase family)
MIKIDKELRRLMRVYNFELVRTGSHYTWHGPNGAIVVTSKTPGKKRYLKEIEKNIKKQI